jgi:hypothetical protein
VHDTDLMLVELPLSRGRSCISLSGSGFQNFKNSLSVCLSVCPCARGRGIFSLLVKLVSSAA